MPAARKLLNDLSKLGIRAAQWTSYKWSAEYSKRTSVVHISFSGPVLGTLKWACPEYLGLSSIACGLALGIFTRRCTNGVSLPRRIACGATDQTADHVISTCPMHRVPREVAGLMVLDNDTQHHNNQHLIPSVFLNTEISYEEEEEGLLATSLFQQDKKQLV